MCIMQFVLIILFCKIQQFHMILNRNWIALRVARHLAAMKTIVYNDIIDVSKGN